MKKMPALPPSGEVDEAKVKKAFEVARLPEAQRETRELVEMFQYPGAVTPDALEQVARDGMRRSIESNLQFGAALCLLKSTVPHGDFVRRIESMGVNMRVAQRYMSAALRFVKSDKKSLLLGAGNTAKLLEFVSVDDEVIDSAAAAGKLDKLDGMTASELRETLRETQAKLEHSEQKREGQARRIDALEVERKGFAKLPPDEQLAKLTDKTLAVMRDALGCIKGSLRQAVIAVRNHSENRGQHDAFLGGVVSELKAELELLRDEFDLPQVESAEKPWLKGVKELRQQQNGKQR